ncbi:MAG TPA: histidinol-phosphate transaminase, partial [Chloroflexota bacterium]|nr:histidinol-phosphate transaminase [Chloroflexota bacterium]
MAYVRPMVTRLLRPAMAGLEAYAAPRPLEEFARSLGIRPEDVVKLDQNENPYGCSPRVRQELAAFSWFHVYPDPDHRVLCERLAEYAGAEAGAIFVGNGSDELIELLLRLFVEPGDKVISAAPTFGYYATAAEVAGARYVTVPRGPRFEIIPEAIAEQVDARTKLVFVASPNNPTGNATPLEVVERLLALDVVVVLDEAYFEFAGRTALPLLNDGAENLVVLRTFSKWAGLAGMRLGYGIFPKPLREVVAAAKAPYSVSQAAEVAGLASLDDLAYLRSTVERILAERERLAAELARADLLVPYPSDANFLLCDVKGMSAARLQDELARRAILVRRYSSPRLENCLRVS